MDLKEYFCQKGCCYWHEYDYSYGGLDVKDRRIVIIGNDCSSAAIYFLLKGAKCVIGYEKNHLLNTLSTEVCQYFGVCEKMRLKGEWKGEYENADIFVMDCEGCEDLLDLSKLNDYEQVCIAVHYWAKRKSELIEYFQKNGFKVTYVTPDMNEVVFCRYKKDKKS